MKSCSIIELELWYGAKFWVVTDEDSKEDIGEFYEEKGSDIEAVRMWAVRNGYEKIEFL